MVQNVLDEVDETDDVGKEDVVHAHDPNDNIILENNIDDDKVLVVTAANMFLGTKQN